MINNLIIIAIVSLYSPIDGLLLDGYPSVKVHTGCDFTRKSAFRIQWTEMYFLGDGQQNASRDVNKLTAELAKAFCRTLMPHLSRLSSDGLTNIGLRVNIDSENVMCWSRIGVHKQQCTTPVLSHGHVIFIGLATYFRMVWVTSFFCSLPLWLFLINPQQIIRCTKLPIVWQNHFLGLW